MSRIASVLLLATLMTGCDMEISQSFQDLLVIRNRVADLVDTPNVSINVRNGSTLTLRITNSSVNGRTSEDRKVLADQIAPIAYWMYTDRRALQTIDVVFSSHERKLAVVDVTSTVDRFAYVAEEIREAALSADRSFSGQTAGAH